jgi:hypothetical protein
MKNMLGIILLLLTIGSAAQTPSKISAESHAITAAGASVGRRVCAIHPEESVWLFDGKEWDKYPCSSVATIFAKNKIDLVKDYLFLQESIHSIGVDLKNFGKAK